MLHPRSKNDTPPLAGEGGLDKSWQTHHTQSSKDLLPLFTLSAPKGTSDSAAKDVAVRTPTQRNQIYQAIAESGVLGLTDEEGQALTGIKTQSYTPRRGELFKLGKIRDSGNRRKTKAGCYAAVWVCDLYFVGDGDG